MVLYHFTARVRLVRLRAIAAFVTTVAKIYRVM